MYAKKIKGFQKYYIHERGYVFKSIGTKEVVIPIKIIKTVPKVLIGNKNYNMVFLMMEYFGNKVIPYDETSQYRFKYKIIEGKLPLEHIKLIKYNSSKHADIKMFTFKCLNKANSANSRVNNISTISENDVFDSLLRSNFCCSYCGRRLDPKIWELDHIEPLSRSGLNTSTNIAPSCKKCNRMKSNMDLMDFIHSCRMIADNFKDSEYLNCTTFKRNQDTLIN